MPSDRRPVVIPGIVSTPTSSRAGNQPSELLAVVPTLCDCEQSELLAVVPTLCGGEKSELSGLALPLCDDERSELMTVCTVYVAVSSLNG